MSPKSIGLFLGAGASYEAGMPLIWELTAETRNWLTLDKLVELNEGWRLQSNGFSDAVIKNFASVLVREDFHYENILGYLEIQFRRRESESEKYHALYSWLVELVYQLLYYRQVNNTIFLEKHLSYYEGLRGLVKANHHLWIFSLNHDVIIEAIAAKFSIPLYNGFSSSIIELPTCDSFGNQKGKISCEILTKKDLKDYALQYPNPPRPGIYLMKLHGALDIFTHHDGNDLLKLLPSEPNLNGVISVLRSANEDLFYLLPGAPGGRAKVVNEIAYADENGEMQFLRKSLLAGAFKFDPHGTQVLPKILLKHFRSNLNFVSNLICIGYSFSDTHINQCMREWLEAYSYRHLEIVDIKDVQIPPFLMHLALQVHLRKLSATYYLDESGSVIRTPKEKFEKTVLQVLRRPVCRKV